MREVAQDVAGGKTAALRYLTARVTPEFLKTVKRRAIELDCTVQELVVASVAMVLDAGIDPRR